MAKSPLRQRWRPASDRDPVPSSPQEQIIKVNAEPPMSDEKEVLWDLREVVDDVSDLGVSFDERKGRHDFRGEALDTARPEVERPAKSQ